MDIQDGKILMALLEVLSGQKLMHEYKSSTHRIFRLNNIAKALKFLEDSNVKLVSIDAAEIADGNSSLVLGLIWNIILFFQIKELTGNLNRNSSSSSLSSGPSGPESDTSYPSTPNIERSMSVTVKDQRKAIRALLFWVQRKTRKYGVAVQDFTSSWRSGLAFLAVIKAIDSTLVDMKHALEKSARENLEDAFSIAQNKLGVPRLLEPEDIMVESPDEQSIVTYVAQFLEHFPELEGEDFTDPEKELPIESTYVHIKDAPSEKESKILILRESDQNMYTVNHERSHPAPPKVHIHDTPERILSETVPEACNGKLSQMLGDSQEIPEDEPRRPTSLKITGSVSFESSSSWEVLSDKLMPGDGSISDDPLKQNDDLSPAVLTDQKNSVDSFEDYSEELTKETYTEYDNETKSLSANTSSLSPLSWTSVTDILHEKGISTQDYNEDAPEPGLGNNLDAPSLEMGTENGEEETIGINSHSSSFYEKEVPLLIGEIEIEIDSQKATNNEDSMILQHPESRGDNLGDFATVGIRLEESSNGEEENENTMEAEDLQISKVGHTSLFHDELEEIADSQEFNRTNDNDSNVHLRKRFPDTSEMEIFGKKEQKTTEMSENLLMIGMKKDTETNETAAPPCQAPSVEQSEQFYFIIFLWVLVYCLLVLPQLFSFKA
ncbi:CLMN protein, partial [Odontophorus gujanensis]|nr:CLMN protein [Odontophorus gujanensis]